MATQSSVLAWRIPGTGEPGGLLSMGSHRVGHDWSDLVVVVVVKSLTYRKNKENYLSFKRERQCLGSWARNGLLSRKEQILKGYHTNLTILNFLICMANDSRKFSIQCRIIIYNIIYYYILYFVEYLQNIWNRISITMCKFITINHKR